MASVLWLAFSSFRQWNTLVAEKSISHQAPFFPRAASDWVSKERFLLNIQSTWIELNDNLNEMLKFIGIYGFILLPPGWTSFKSTTNDATKHPEFVKLLVGDYSYFAFALVLIMQFAAKIGVAGMPNIFIGEVFPCKLVY